MNSRPDTFRAESVTRYEARQRKAQRLRTALDGAAEGTDRNRARPRIWPAQRWPDGDFAGDDVHPLSPRAIQGGCARSGDEDEVPSEDGVAGCGARQGHSLGPSDGRLEHIDSSRSVFTRRSALVLGHAARHERLRGGSRTGLRRRHGQQTCRHGRPSRDQDRKKLGLPGDRPGGLPQRDGKAGNEIAQDPGDSRATETASPAWQPALTGLNCRRRADYPGPRRADSHSAGTSQSPSIPSFG